MVYKPLWFAHLIKYCKGRRKKDLNDISEYSTVDLVEELKRRGGVQSIEIASYDKVKLSIDNKPYPLDIGSSGPATILVVYD